MTNVTLGVSDYWLKTQTGGGYTHQFRAIRNNLIVNYLLFLFIVIFIFKIIYIVFVFVKDLIIKIIDYAAHGSVGNRTKWMIVHL